MNRALAFEPKMKSGYEIWFGTAMDASGLALWFRYTILHRTSGPSVCVLWAALFDPKTPSNAVHAAESWPVDQQRFQDGRLSLPQGSCTCDDVQGQMQDLSWDLRIEHRFDAESHVPEFLLKLPFVRTKSIILSPFARFTGTVRKGSQTWNLDAHGTWTHIYGTERVPELYWCFVPQFDQSDVGMELFSVRPKASLPRLTFFTLREGNTLRHSGLLGAFRSSCKVDFPGFTAFAPGGAFKVECQMDQAQAASYIYVDPDLSNRYVVQSDVSTAKLTLGDGRIFDSKQQAAVEFHGLAPWSDATYLDPYRKFD